MESNRIVINRIKTSAKEKGRGGKGKRKREKGEKGEEVSELQMGDLLCRTIPDFRGQQVNISRKKNKSREKWVIRVRNSRYFLRGIISQRLRRKGINRRRRSTCLASWLPLPPGVRTGINYLPRSTSRRYQYCSFQSLNWLNFIKFARYRAFAGLYRGSLKLHYRFLSVRSPILIPGIRGLSRRRRR